MTGLETKIAALDAKFARYPQAERRAAMELLNAILSATESKDFSHLGGDLLPFVLSILPSIGSGAAGSQLIVAIDAHAPAIRASVSAALGPVAWQKRVDVAKRALS